MCLVCGVNKSHIESIEKLFSEDDGRPIFRKTMILTRFKTLRRMLKFDNLNASNSRLSSNKLVAVCLLFNNLLNNSQSFYLPGQAATAGIFSIFFLRPPSVGLNFGHSITLLQHIFGTCQCAPERTK